MLKENKKYARFAGFYWLLFVIFGMLSYMVADAKLLVVGDATMTLNNMNSNMGLFYFGVVTFVIGYGVFIPLAGYLRKLFKTVDNNLTKIMMGLVVVGAAMVIVGKALEIFALNVSVEEATHLFELRTSIEMAGELFWGLWLIPLVMLILKSDIIHKWVGWLLAVAAVIHLCVFASFFFISTFMPVAETLLNLAAPCELIPVGYFLIKGVKIPKQKQGV
jgi:hypothetical protein